MRICSILLAASLVVALPDPALAGTIRYPFDVNHSTVGFAASILKAGRVTGKFTDFKGEILVPEDKDLTKASVEVTIQVVSVDTGVPDRDEHLRTEDFFDATKYPEITFRSTKVTRQGDGYLVEGTFSMRGVVKTITIPFQVRALARFMAVGADLTINRREYGIAYNRVMDDGAPFVDDEVEIHLVMLTRIGKLLPETPPATPATPPAEPAKDGGSAPIG
ncbi:MAG TPA: YceI family protein [Thermoanaerobaculia bacterium]|nr:YceI family protein [Thermoanaerobaculia bacterium]